MRMSLKGSLSLGSLISFNEKPVFEEQSLFLYIFVHIFIIEKLLKRSEKLYL